MGYLIVFVSIWIIFVMCVLSKEMNKTEERIKRANGITPEQEMEFKKQVEEEILELLKGYTDNKIEFNLRSLFNYLEENKVVFTTRPYSPDEYGVDIVLYNYKCNVVCKIIQGFSLVKITRLAIIDQK